MSGPSGGKSKPSRTNSLSDESETRFHVLALCAGIGGIELGLKLAMPESRAVCYVEGEAYAASTLVQAMDSGYLDAAPIWSDVRSFDGKPWRGVVDCIVGGYPCQPFSTVGKRKGENDPRHLWPHFVRIIGEIQPAWCFFENVMGHVSMGLNNVLEGLSSLGYETEVGIFSANEIGASHERCRMYALAHGHYSRLRPKRRAIRIETHRTKPLPRPKGSTRCMARTVAREDFPPPPCDLATWAQILRESPQDFPLMDQSKILGMADGLPTGMDRVRANGNAVVPLVAGYAFSTLRDAFN